MRPRQGTPLYAAFRNPTVIGALTVLVTILAVFLAYNANSGLPFVKTYRLTAQVPDASGLVPGNEVRIGGVRVGVIEDITPVQTEDGATNAALALKLDTVVDPLPTDSTVIIRSRSALGLQYLQVVRGTSDDGYAAGAVLPLDKATPEPVQFDELLQTFDEPTRVGIQENLYEFGNLLAGRGPDLNEAIGRLRPLLPRLERVARVLAEPERGIGPFFEALEQSAAEVAPVAETQAQVFVELNTTLAAFADVARPFIQETISETPVTLQTTTDTLPVIRPFLVNTRGLFRDLVPASKALAASSPDIEEALVTGTPVLRASTVLNAELAPTAQSLRNFNDNADVRTGLRRLTDFNNALGPPLRFIAPAQSVCNYATLLLRNLSNAGSLGNSTGNWQRGNAVGSPLGPNSEGSPSSGPARGGGTDPRNFLHSNPYPNTASPGQTFECESGNEPYNAGETIIGNPAGNQGITTEDQIPSQNPAVVVADPAEDEEETP